MCSHNITISMISYTVLYFIHDQNNINSEYKIN
eukprot:UN05952